MLFRVNLGKEVSEVYMLSIVVLEELIISFLEMVIIHSHFLSETKLIISIIL